LHLAGTELNAMHAQHFVILDFNSWVLGHEKPIFNARPLPAGLHEDNKLMAFRSQMQQTLKNLVAR
jgi:hypothetical protein